MYVVQNAIGWKYISQEELLFFMGLASAVFLVMAYLMDVLMSRLSFGIIMNTMLLVLGAGLGLLGMIWFEMPPTRKDFLPTLFACGVSAVTLLVIMAAFKRAT